MKIAYVAQNIFGEKSRALDVDLISEFSKLADVAVFTQKEGIKGLSESYENGIRCYFIDSEKRMPWLYPIDKLLKILLGVRKFATDVFRLGQFLKKTRPDIVQIESMFPWGVIGYVALIFCGSEAEAIVTQHTVDYLIVPFDYYDRIKSRLILVLTRLSCRRIFVRANSPMCCKWVIASGISENRVRMVPVNIAKAFKWP